MSRVSDDKSQQEDELRRAHEDWLGAVGDEAVRRLLESMPAERRVHANGLTASQILDGIEVVSLLASRAMRRENIVSCRLEKEGTFRAGKKFLSARLVALEIDLCTCDVEMPEPSQSAISLVRWIFDAARLQPNLFPHVKVGSWNADWIEMVPVAVEDREPNELKRWGFISDPTIPAALLESPIIREVNAIAAAEGLTASVVTPMPPMRIEVTKNIRRAVMIRRPLSHEES
jgi:hypothetical protein